MQRVCDVLEELTAEGILGNYAIGGATAAGFHGEPLATMDVDVFVFLKVKRMPCWSRWSRFSGISRIRASIPLRRRR